MDVRLRVLIFVIGGLCLLGVCAAQDAPPVEQVPTDKSAPPPKDNRKQPPRSDDASGEESSSKETQIDVSPPKNDAKSHPEADLGGDTDEFTPYNPMKAMKDVEVGDFYMKRENYKAAISRYREALEWKPRDAEATFRLAEALSRTGDAAGAKETYEAYLKILPHGPYAKKAKEALSKLPSPAPAKEPASARKAHPPINQPQSGGVQLEGGVTPH